MRLVVRLPVAVRPASATWREASGTMPLASGTARQASGNTRLASGSTPLAWGNTPEAWGNTPLARVTVFETRFNVHLASGNAPQLFAWWPNGSSVVTQAWCVFREACRGCRQSWGVLVQASGTDPKARRALTLATGVSTLARHAVTEARLAAGQAWFVVGLATDRRP